MNFAPDDRVDRYVLVEPLGAGGQGSVWKAEDPLAPGVTRAIKLVASQHARPDQVERVRREARALADLHHPSLVKCHGLFEDLSHGVIGIVMDFVEGRTLRSTYGDPRMTADHATAALLQVAGALAYLHRSGRVHRDLKGENVIVASTFWDAPNAPGGVRLVDFGVASLEDNPDPLTMVGGVLGTVSHMAPELLDRRYFPAEPAKPTLDVFAFGVMGWLLLAGEHPSGLPRGSTVVDHATRFREAAEGRASWPSGSVDGPWGVVLRASLSLRAAERLQSGSDIASAFERASKQSARSADTVVDPDPSGNAGNLRVGAAREASPLSSARTVVDAEAVPTATALTDLSAGGSELSTEAPTVLEAAGAVQPATNAAPAVASASSPEPPPRGSTLAARAPASASRSSAPLVVGLAALVGGGVAGYFGLVAQRSTDDPSASLPPSESSAGAARLAKAAERDPRGVVPFPDATPALVLPDDCTAGGALCDCCLSGRDCGPGTCSDPLAASASWHLSLARVVFADDFDLAQLSKPEVCLDSDFHREICTPIALGPDGGRRVRVEPRSILIGPLATTHLRQGPLRVIVRDATYSPVPLARGTLRPVEFRSALCKGVGASLDGVVASLTFLVDPYPVDENAPAERCVMP